MTRAASAWLLAIAASAVLPSCTRQAVVLRLDPPEGQVTHLTMQSRTWTVLGDKPISDTAPPTMNARIYSTQTVASTEAGVRTITVTVDSSWMEVRAGTMMPAMGGDWMKGVTTTRRVNNDGDVLSVATTPGPNSPPMMAGRMPDYGSSAGQYSFPKRPLHVGDTWTATMAAPGQPGGASPVSGTVTARLEKIETRAGVQLATISSKGTAGVSASNAMSVAGSYEFELVVDVTHRRLAHLTSEARTRISSPFGPMASLTRVEMTSAD